MSARVLVIEDDAATLRLLGSVLKLNDLEPVLLSNAEDALERLPAEQPALILCDLNLPGIDGASFVEIVRSSQLADVRLILMSAYGEPKQHSADAFLAKPFDPFELVDLIGVVMRDGEHN